MNSGRLPQKQMSIPRLATTTKPTQAIEHVAYEGTRNGNNAVQSRWEANLVLFPQNECFIERQISEYVGFCLEQTVVVVIVTVAVKDQCEFVSRASLQIMGKSVFLCNVVTEALILSLC